MLHSTKVKVRLVVLCLVHRAVQRGSTCKRVQIRENNTSLHFAKAVSGFLKKSVETFWFEPKKNDMKRYQTIWNDTKRYERYETIWNDMEKGAKKKRYGKPLKNSSTGLQKRYETKQNFSHIFQHYSWKRYGNAFDSSGIFQLHSAKTTRPKNHSNVIFRDPASDSDNSMISSSRSE